MSDIKPKFELADAMAVKACFSGEADAIQQRRAMTWIVRGICRSQTLGWDQESVRWTDFMSGRRMVGLELEYYFTATPRELHEESAKRMGIPYQPHQSEHG